MAKTGSVVETRQSPLPAELGGRQEIDVNPPENVIYEPMGLTVTQIGPDLWQYQYLITPFKVVSIRLNGEGKALLDEQSAGKKSSGLIVPQGGIVVPS